MGVAILKPKDCLKLPNLMIHPKNPCPNPNRMNRIQPNRKKGSANTSPPSRPTVSPKTPANNLVIGQVKILKRGEVLKKTIPEKHVRFEKENVDLELGSTSRLGPDPGSVPTQIRLTESNNNINKVVPATFYAGSASVSKFCSNAGVFHKEDWR